MKRIPARPPPAAPTPRVSPDGSPAFVGRRENPSGWAAEATRRTCGPRSRTASRTPGLPTLLPGHPPAFWPTDNLLLHLQQKVVCELGNHPHGWSPRRFGRIGCQRLSWGSRSDSERHCRETGSPARNARPTPSRMGILIWKSGRQLRAWFPARLESPEERWRAKTAVEFRL